MHQHIDAIGGAFHGERYHYRPVERHVQDYDDLIDRLARVTAQPTHQRRAARPRGVERLGYSGQLVEVEAVAVLD